MGARTKNGVILNAVKDLACWGKILHCVQDDGVGGGEDNELALHRSSISSSPGQYSALPAHSLQTIRPQLSQPCIERASCALLQ